MNTVKSPRKTTRSIWLRRIGTPRSATLLATFMMMLALAGATAQDASDGLVDQFRAGDADTKVMILRQIADDPATEVAPVYAAALDYALSNLDQIGSDAQFRALALDAVTRLGQAGHSAAVEDLWRLFVAYPDNTVRIATLETLAQLGRGDAATSTAINEWLLTQNSVPGATVDRQVVIAAVDAAVELGDPSSFEALIDTALARHSRRVSELAAVGIGAIATDAPDTAIGVVLDATPAEMVERLEFVLALEELDLSTRAEVASAALAEATRTITPDAADRAVLRRARSLAAGFLADAEYSQATPSVVAHFNRTVAEYGSGTVTRAALIEAIRAVGAMGTDAAAVRLSRYLDLANTYTEYERPFDTRLVLETLAALDRIGSEEAHDDIYYVTLLDYPDVVIDAARDALLDLSR